MKTMGVTLLLLAGLATSPAAADLNELAGNWMGAVETPRGQMEIALALTIEKDRLIGVLKTGHGDWEVTTVTEKDGVWSVDVKSPMGPAKLSGRVKGTKYTGDWRSPMADGTFELTRSKKR